MPDLERQLVEYLLGRLPEPERVQLEEQLFEDGDMDEQLVATTDELIHSYLRGELRPEDRQGFEDHFLAADDHRQRLDFMRHVLAATRGGVRPAATPRRWWWLAAAALLVATGAVVLSTRDWDTDNRETALSSPPASAPPAAFEDVPVASEPVRPAAPPPRESPPEGRLVVRLSGGGAPPAEVHVAEGTRQVRLQVKVDETSPSFDASIHRSDGTEVWRADGLSPPAAEPLLLEVPARLLAQGVYALRIVGEALRDDAPHVREYRLEVAPEYEAPIAR